MEEARGQKQQTKVSQRKLNQVKVGPHASSLMRQYTAEVTVTASAKMWPAGWHVM